MFVFNDNKQKTRSQELGVNKVSVIWNLILNLQVQAVEV